MQEIRGNKWNKRLCKWIASSLAVTLLVNQSSLSVLAEEYEKYVYIEDVTYTVTDEEAESLDVSSDVSTGMDTNTNVESGIEEDALEFDAEDAISTASMGDTFAYDQLNYKIIIDDADNLQVEVTGHVDGENATGTLDIPSIVSNGTDEYMVVCIGDCAFWDCISLTSITIPDSVTSIGYGAFHYCINLASITIPDSVTSIGYGAFSSCSSLTSITIPDSVTSIGEEAFSNCSSLTSITIPDSVTSIGEEAFSNCSSLTSITIPDGITSIKNETFYNCNSLTNITIPDSVTTIGEEAFYYCRSLESITIPDGVISIGKFAFMCCSSLTSITIPDGVTSIKSSTFNSCSSLTNVTIPDSVTSIEEYAFYWCNHLTNITIPDNVTSIGEEAFMGCISLTSITIPDRVTTIGASAFNGCSSLTNITIPNGVTNIEEYTFGWCSSSTDITIPNSVTSIGKGAFMGCNDLESITIPNSVTSIGGGAFGVCSNLASVTILNDSISIDEYTFQYCTNLKTLQIALSKNITATPTIKDECFSQCPDDRSLTFLTEDGTTELSDSTTPTLADAVKAYNAVNDGDIDDGYWYGWKLPEAGVVTDNEETFTITVSAGIGGSVTPSGEVKVKSGDRQQFTITPEDGYWVSSILADGNEVLNSEQTNYDSQVRSTNTGSSTKYYVFENVTNDHTLAAYFETINTDDNSDSDDSVGNDTIDNDGSDDTNPVAVSESSTTNSSDIVSINTAAPAPQDNEPKTGYDSHIEIYATITMIAGLSYLLLYFTDGKDGMTEDEKKEIIAALVKWAQKGKRLRRFAALAIIFLILVYYHSIGKRTAVECKSIEWKAVYEK